MRALTLFTAALTLAVGCDDATSTSGGESDDSVGETWSPGDEQTDYDGPLSFTGDRPWNVLMISVDTFRVEDMGWFDGGDTTPNLDALFAEGVVLEQHRSCSNWTYASTVCFQGGASDVEQGFVAAASDSHGGGPGGQEMDTVPGSVVQGAELLRDAGWATSLISTNGFLSSNYNNAQGFDDETVLGHDEMDAETVTDTALAELAALSSGDDPWFLHVHYIDPHSSYDPPSEYITGLDGLQSIDYDPTSMKDVEELSDDWDRLSESERSLIQQHLQAYYDGELRYVDDMIGQLLASAEADGLLEDTLIVFWTDHGEGLGEHAEIGHHANLYDEVNRTVVAFAAPGLSAQSWTAPTMHADAWPTMLEILPYDFGAPMSGPALGDRDSDGPLLAAKYLSSAPSAFAIEGDMKLYYWWDGSAELYDLAADPGETEDLIDAQPDDASALWETLGSYVDAVEALRGEGSPVDPGL